MNKVYFTKTLFCSGFILHTSDLMLYNIYRDRLMIRTDSRKDLGNSVLLWAT